MGLAQSHTLPGKKFGKSKFKLLLSVFNLIVVALTMNTSRPLAANSKPKRLPRHQPCSPMAVLALAPGQGALTHIHMEARLATLSVS